MSFSETEKLVRFFAFDLGHLSANLFYIWTNAVPDVQFLSELEFKITPALNQIQALKQVKKRLFPEFFNSDLAYDSFITSLDETNKILTQFRGQKRSLSEQERNVLWGMLRYYRDTLNHFKLLYQEEYEESFRI